MDGPEVVLRSRVAKLLLLLAALSKSQHLGRRLESVWQCVIIDCLFPRTTGGRIEGEVAKGDGMDMSKLAVLRRLLGSLRVHPVHERTLVHHTEGINHGRSRRLHASPSGASVFGAIVTCVYNCVFEAMQGSQ